jgi:two-component system, OmpR family, phosphate regulon sensor histidine kinase PhoR
LSAPLGLRGRIAVTALAASAAALLAVLLLVGPRLRENALEHTRGELLADARLMARVVEEPLARGMTSAELDALVDEAARDVRKRVTVILPDGRVVADSANSGDALAAEENHAGRPEIVQALASGTGSSLRHSVTVKDDLLYAAVAIRHQGHVVGVSRVAFSVAGIEGQVADLRWKVVLALALAFVVTAVLSVLLSSSLAGPLADIMETARQVGAGNFGTRIRVRRNDELGELAHILNLSADQLQQRLTENARDRARTEAILSAMDDGVLAVDHRGIVILANNALRHNLDLQDPIGHHHIEAIRQREVGDVLQEVLRTARRKAVEVELLHQRRAFALTAVPFPGAEGTPHGAVLTFHDITERRRLERIRRDFVANASHELRTPLTSIRGFVEALEDGAMAEPETAARFLGKIHTHADRMGSLVEDLLELSRLESGERPPLWEEVPPTEIAEDVAASFGGQAGRKGIALSKSDSGAPPVTTDADRLRRIVENLVDNAIKYTPTGGHVEIRTAPGPQGGATVEVRDDGPGIPAEHLPRIFERFYRVDKARSRELGGTGLGLAIVKHLAEGMGATVTVASDIGKGTRFTVSVPLRPGPSTV